jgi:hypothetical protein
MLWQENGVSLVALKFIAKIRDNGERRQRQADQEFKPREHVGHGAYCVFYFREATAHESIACQCIVIGEYLEPSRPPSGTRLSQFGICRA